jgi:hypothetical protein
MGEQTLKMNQLTDSANILTLQNRISIDGGKSRISTDELVKKISEYVMSTYKFVSHLNYKSFLLIL